ncbi:SDR family oxidoreductase [Paucilactobacillus kaifaensis]|uniref:SDR family oxidoreductase n=1 Tax=Paucilactobacillus kaifaensis TaxID=2559921 RepID=UPI0010F933A9|nr:SDR family oxidoreductase [Paucilactobacillus kaifaensis]
MKILVIGAHGNVGQKLIRILSAQGDQVLAGVRDPAQLADLHDENIIPTKFDLEQLPDTLAQKMIGIDAIVFTAGSGGKTGADKTMLVDLDGAVKSMQAAQIAGVQRFVIVSALYTDDRQKWVGDMRPYYAAKYYADQWLINQTNLNYTIVRPGGLTNDAGTGLVQIDAEQDVAGSVAREDVAKVVAASLHNSKTAKRVFNLISGEKSIDEALNEL